MVFTKTKIKNIAKEFAAFANDQKFPVEQIYLFGSYAYGKPNKYSDIDFAIVSSKLDRLDDIKRIIFLKDIARKIKESDFVDIETVGYTPEEFKNAGYFDLAGEIKDKGKLVYSRK